MALLTHEIEVLLQEQFVKVWSNEADYMQLPVVCKIFHPLSNWTFYLITQDPEDPDYLWGIVKGFEIEIGSVQKSALEAKIQGLSFERDLYFQPRLTKDIFQDLLNGDHV